MNFQACRLSDSYGFIDVGKQHWKSIPLHKSFIKCRWLCFTKCRCGRSFHKHLVLHSLWSLNISEGVTFRRGMKIPHFRFLISVCSLNDHLKHVWKQIGWFQIGVCNKGGTKMHCLGSKFISTMGIKEEGKTTLVRLEWLDFGAVGLRNYIAGVIKIPIWGESNNTNLG